MNLVVLAAMVLFAVILIAMGSPRVYALRRPGIEGIEDLESARAYDLVSRLPPFRLLRRLIVNELARRQPQGILADIGCGPGYLAILVARRFPILRILGVDASEEMIHSAEANAARARLSKNVEFREGDVDRLPFENAEIDFAISTLSLHHWSDPAAGLVEVHRVLKPGGRMMLFDLRRDARRCVYWLLTFVQFVVVPAGLRRINEPLGSLQSSYTLAEMEGMLRASPFDNWHVKGAGMWMFAWADKRAEQAV